MSKKSQILNALRAGLGALCAAAVYETTKQICFPRMSLGQSHIITIFFAGCVGFCISFIIRQREKAAQEEPLRLAAIVEQSDDAIISTELDGIVTSWNRGAERIYGYSALEALGRHISFSFSPEKHAELHVLWQKIANGECYIPEWLLRLIQSQFSSSAAPYKKCLLCPMSVGKILGRFNSIGRAASVRTRRSCWNEF